MHVVYKICPFFFFLAVMFSEESDNEGVGGTETETSKGRAEPPGLPEQRVWCPQENGGGVTKVLHSLWLKIQHKVHFFFFSFYATFAATMINYMWRDVLLFVATFFSYFNQELQKEKNSLTLQLDQSSRHLTQLEEEKKNTEQNLKRTQGLFDDLKGKIVQPNKSDLVKYVFFILYWTVILYFFKQNQKGKRRSWREFSPNWNIRVKCLRRSCQTWKRHFVMQRPKMKGKHDKSDLVRCEILNNLICWIHNFLLIQQTHCATEPRMSWTNRSREQRCWQTGWQCWRRRIRIWNPTLPQVRKSVMNWQKNTKLCWTGRKKRSHWLMMLRKRKKTWITKLSPWKRVSSLWMKLLIRWR